MHVLDLFNNYSQSEILNSIGDINMDQVVTTFKMS